MSASQLNKFIKECETIENHLSTNENDNDELLTPTVNSKYYNLKKFNSLKIDKTSSFGFLHVNIASLNKHFDELHEVLSRTKFNFDVIGISEHKIQKDNLPSNNISLPGYDDFIFEPTGTTHGGTGFYIKSGIDYIERHDLKLNHSSCIR